MKQDVASYIKAHRHRFLDELKEWLRVASISADAAYLPQIRHCAEMVKKSLLSASCDTASIIETAGLPMVYGEKIVSPELPTVLVYGHYDVQPPGDEHEWTSPPFEPEVRDGKIFARGAADDKGQFHMHVKALETMLQTGPLPVNLRFIVEGEEEIASPSLGPFILEHREMLQADVVLISDNTLVSLSKPSLEAGFRGACMLELEVTGASRDLHSGTFGGAVPNPLTILSHMIASCHNEDLSVAVPGFYDNVIPFSEEDRELLNALPFNENEYRSDLGIRALHGEKGYTTAERTGMRPTLELNGMYGGYTGEGIKTVLPSKAFAKLSCRLVPGQTAERITRILSGHFHAICPPSARLTVKTFAGSEPYVVPRNSAGYRAAHFALWEVLGREPVPVWEGGSLPLCHLIEKHLGVKSVLLGFGLADDNIHGVDEKFELENYFKGIETIISFHHHFADVKKSEP